ncbi:hypothetical protein [Chondromyces crocatus]|uniref:hypothetical protein n=1 Tax=Chondromyces crocatus TaxID=52 RepID=UPI00147051F5|nr:hypothetical protein [Chondromyces crocatus]
MVPLQIGLGAMALAAIWVRTRAVIPRAGWLKVLLLLALPWHALALSQWSMAPAMSLGVLGVVGFERALRTSRAGQAVMAGVAFGAALNVRSELLLWTVGCIVCGVQFAMRAERSRRTWKPLLTFVATVALCLAPWALWYRAHTGRTSLVSSNGGMVAYLSLGQLPGNPWGIVADDAFAVAFLRARADGVDPVSDAGDQRFAAAFRDAIREHPGAFARKILHNGRNAVLGGFHVGEVPLDADERVALDVVKERIKLAAGLNPNQAEIAQYKAQGVWENARLSGRGVFAVAFQASGVLLGALFLGMMGVGLCAALPRWRKEPWLVLLASVVVLQLASVALFQYQPRHVNVLSVVGAPFVVLGVDAAGRLIRRVAARKRAV